MTDAERIQRLISDRPGRKVQQIADALGLGKAEVTEMLYGRLGSDVIQDSAYLWWPRTREAPHPSHSPQTLLNRVCRYYLDCLSRESGAGISLPASAQGAEYVALEALPFVSRPTTALGDRAVKKLAQKVRRERGQLALYVGYPVRVRRFIARNEEETRLDPVLLYPVPDKPDGPTWPIEPGSGIPLFNLEVLKSLPSADSGNLIDEAIQLSDELGLANAEGELPEWDEIIFRLKHCRPDWDWREELNPYELSQGVPAGELSAPGIYNRAILVAGARSPFTYGLEVELGKLAQLEENAYRDTALGHWLGGDSNQLPGQQAAAEDRPLLEVVPLNAEQRQAVLQGLSNRLTVVTGPPGTGKSQVVMSLLVNIAWQGGSVLFASKNNHAVDVVESRMNDLGPYPMLLRLGKEEHHTRLAEHLSAALADSSSVDDAAGYAWRLHAHGEWREKFEAVQHSMTSLVAVRNDVDELERAVEPARSLFGEARFASLRFLDLAQARRQLEELSSAIAAATESRQPAIVRLVWDSVKNARYARVAETGSALCDWAGGLAIEHPDTGHDLAVWEQFLGTLAQRIEVAARVQAYFQALDRLRSADTLESLAGRLTEIAQDSAGNSLELWRYWLRLRPARLKPEQRKLLSEYVALLQMIAGGDRFDEGAGRKVFRRYYSIFPEVARLLPCWAVTSLSARGRFPFEPALFDVVVIDEASQCDIASALPLLFRAKSAVIIGDPLQLKHVSTVTPKQDRQMLAGHGLAEGRAAWGYSVNSLFDLARSFCRYEDILNLRDHHRSHGDIIAFSNRHFYRGGLRVATDYDNLNLPDPGGPAVRWMEVKGRVVRPSAGGALNAAEADAVIAELRRLVLDRGYGGTVGVVSPFRAQANRIRTLVHQDQDLSRRLAALQFVADTVHGFQGDERDVILFSPVVSAGTGESALRFLKGHGNLFNVAVTRARSELTVVGDREAAIQCGVSYLAKFADYAASLGTRQEAFQAPAESPGPDYPTVSQPELVSDWERVFYKAMYAAGLRPIPQYPEAPYTLDFALFDGDRQLDIEVDGEHYHRNWDGERCRRDQIRTRRLRDLGWDVMRFWVYEVRDDLNGCISRVKTWLE